MGNQNLCQSSTVFNNEACYANEIEPSSTLDEFFEQIPPLQNKAGAVRVAGYKGCYGKMQVDIIGSSRPQLPPDFMLDVKLLSPKQQLEATSRDAPNLFSETSFGPKYK